VRSKAAGFARYAAPRGASDGPLARTATLHSFVSFAQDSELVALAEQQIGFLEFLMALTHAVHAKYARRSPPLPLAEALDEAMQAMRCRLPISPKAEDPFLLGVLTPAARATLARSARELRAVFDTYSTAEAPTTVAAGDAGRALLTASDLIEVARDLGQAVPMTEQQAMLLFAQVRADQEPDGDLAALGDGDEPHLEFFEFEEWMARACYEQLRTVPSPLAHSPGGKGARHFTQMLGRVTLAALKGADQLDVFGDSTDEPAPPDEPVLRPRRRLSLLLNRHIDLQLFQPPAAAAESDAFARRASWYDQGDASVFERSLHGWLTTVAMPALRAQMASRTAARDIRKIMAYQEPAQPQG
jgi:hypothetical protein